MRGVEVGVHVLGRLQAVLLSSTGSTRLYLQYCPVEKLKCAALATGDCQVNPTAHRRGPLCDRS